MNTNLLDALSVSYRPALLAALADRPPRYRRTWELQVPEFSPETFQPTGSNRFIPVDTSAEPTQLETDTEPPRSPVETAPPRPHFDSFEPVELKPNFDSFEPVELKPNFDSFEPVKREQLAKEKARESKRGARAGFLANTVDALSYWVVEPTTRPLGAVMDGLSAMGDQLGRAIGLMPKDAPYVPWSKTVQQEIQPLAKPSPSTIPGSELARKLTEAGVPKQIFEAVGGADDFMSGLANFMLNTPIGWATMASGAGGSAAGHQAVTTAFMVDMAKEAPTVAAEIVEAYQQGDVQRATKATLDGLMVGGVVGGGAYKLGKARTGPGPLVEGKPPPGPPEPVPPEVDAAARAQPAAMVGPPLSTAPPPGMVNVPRARFNDLMPPEPGLLEREWRQDAEQPARLKQLPPPLSVGISEGETVRRVPEFNAEGQLIDVKREAVAPAAPGAGIEPGPRAPEVGVTPPPVIVPEWQTIGDVGEGRAKGTSGRIAKAFRGIEEKYDEGTPAERKALDLVADNEFATRFYRRDPNVPDEAIFEAYNRIMQESGLAWQPPQPKPIKGKKAGAPAKAEPTPAPEVPKAASPLEAQAAPIPPSLGAGELNRVNPPPAKRQQTPERMRLRQEMDSAWLKVEEAHLTWIYDQNASNPSAIGREIRKLPKAKRAIAEAYETLLDEWVKATKAAGAAAELREGPDRLDLAAQAQYGRSYAELNPTERAAFWRAGDFPGREQSGTSPWASPSWWRPAARDFPGREQSGTSAGRQPVSGGEPAPAPAPERRTSELRPSGARPALSDEELKGLLSALRIEKGSAQAVFRSPGGKQFPLPSEQQATKRVANIDKRIAEVETQIAARKSRGLIAGTSAEAWADRTIQRSKSLGVRPVGGDELLAAYTVKGAALLERGLRKWAHWSAAMIREFGDGVRPYLRQLYGEATATLDNAQTTLKQRKLAARGAVSAQILPAHQERLKTGPESFYETQSKGDLKNRVGRLSNDELAAIPIMQEAGPNNAWALAKLELYNRLKNAARTESNPARAQALDDQAWSHFEETMRAGTSMGQLISQLTELRSAVPENVPALVNRRLKSEGFDPLPPSGMVETRQAAERSQQSRRAWDEAERTYRQAPTDEHAAAAARARIQAIVDQTALQTVIQSYTPRSGWELLTTIMKGNFMAPISIAANVGGNVTNLGLRGILRGAEAGLDMIDSYLRNVPRRRTVAPVAATWAAWKASVGSLPDAWRTLYRGASDFELAKGEVKSGLHPLRAFRDMLAGYFQPPRVTQRGVMPIGQRILAMVEASPQAMQANAMFRLLAATDLPFRMPARARAITHELKLQDLNRQARIKQLITLERNPGEQLELDWLKSRPGDWKQNLNLAVRAPELFLDARSLERVETETQRAIYTQRNPVTKASAMIQAGMKPSARFWLASVMPFTRTPSNVIGEWLSWTPAISFANTIRYAAKGDALAARRAASQFVIGSMVVGAGAWLAKRGLISPSLDQSDEAQKARILAGQIMPASSLNVSGLKRAIGGGDPTWRAGDETRNIIRAGGIAGTLMMISADTMRQMERQPEPPGALGIAGMGALNSLTLTAGYWLNQSFLKGTATLLRAVQEDKADQWFIEYAAGLGVIPLPNTLTALSRTLRQNKPDFRGDSLDQRLENKLRDRLGVFGMTKDLPLKRDLWGRPIRETPEGASPWIYQMFDVSKAVKIPQDPLGLQVYSLWRATADNGVIPTPPDRRLEFGRRVFDLTRQQESRLAEMIGQKRYTIGLKMIDHPEYLSGTTQHRARVLKRAWLVGSQAGTRQFLMENIARLAEKKVPAGLKIP